MAENEMGITAKDDEKRVLCGGGFFSTSGGFFSGEGGSCSAEAENVV